MQSNPLIAKGGFIKKLIALHDYNEHKIIDQIKVLLKNNNALVATNQISV